MQSLEMTSGDLETTSEFSLGNDFQETIDVWVARGYSNCWKLRRVADEAHNMTENALSILIIFSVQLQQMETSDR